MRSPLKLTEVQLVGRLQVMKEDDPTLAEAMDCAISTFEGIMQEKHHASSGTRPPKKSEIATEVALVRELRETKKRIAARLEQNKEHGFARPPKVVRRTSSRMSNRMDAGQMPHQLSRREQLMDFLEDPRMGMFVIFLVFIDVLAICGKVCTLTKILPDLGFKQEKIAICADPPENGKHSQGLVARCTQSHEVLSHADAGVCERRQRVSIQMRGRVLRTQ